MRGRPRARGADRCLRGTSGVAAAVLGTVGDPARFGDRDRFAAYNGTAPIEVSSGGRKIHRLSLRGNRRLNHAIHMAAVTQIRHAHSGGRAYFDRKSAEGKTGKEAPRPGGLSGRERSPQPGWHCCADPGPPCSADHCGCHAAPSSRGTSTAPPSSAPGSASPGPARVAPSPWSPPAGSAACSSWPASSPGCGYVAWPSARPGPGTPKPSLSSWNVSRSPLDNTGEPGSAKET